MSSDTAATNGHRAPQAITPPHDLEAEESVLGAILLADRTMHHLALETGLTEHDFYREQHRLMFASMRTLYNAGQPVDQLTLADQLAREGQLDAAGGRAAIEALYGSVPNAANAPRYAEIVRNSATTRRLLSATYDIQHQISTARQDPTELIEAAERRILELRATHLPGVLTTLGDAVSGELDRLQRAADDPREVPGLSTGVRELDRMLGGLKPGRLYVIAARPEMGKSLLVLQVALHAALKSRARTLFALLEMDDAETAERYLAMQSGIDTERLRLKKLQEQDWPALLKAGATAADAPLHLLDDSHTSLSSLRAHARQLLVRHGELELIIVDYLQLMHVEETTGNRTTDVSTLSRGLKVMAREFHCPVIAVSQLNRAVELRNDKRPQLSDLRETGAIEADANVVAMLYREDYYYGKEAEHPGQVEVILRKNRDGHKGTVYLHQDQHLRQLPAHHE